MCWPGRSPRTDFLSGRANLKSFVSGLSWVISDILHGTILSFPPSATVGLNHPENIFSKMQSQNFVQDKEIG